MNERKKTQYAQDHELVSLLFPFPKQTLLTFYSSDCENEKELILFH